MSIRAVAISAIGSLALLLCGAAFAADPVDETFGIEGLVEVEASVPTEEEEQEVGGIVDLAAAKGGKLLAAVYPIASGGHYFAVARFDRDGSLDTSFGRDGFTDYISVFHRGGEMTGGVMNAEAVTEDENGNVVLAGYLVNEGATATAVARFTPDGKLDRTFGRGGKVIPLPSSEGVRIHFGEAGGERLHGVAVDRDGDIIVAGGANELHGQERNPNPTAIVTAYRPDGTIDRGFGDAGRFKVRAPRKNAFTGFTQVEALPSGKLLVSGYVRQQIVLYRLTAKGRPDRAFGGGDGKVTVGRPTSEDGYTFLRAPFAVDRHGRIVICGPTFPASSGSEEPVALVRLLPDGTRDRSFAKSIYVERAPADRAEPRQRRHVQYFSFQPEAIAIDGRGRIVLTGGESAPSKRGQKEAGHEYFGARRYLPDGRRDRSFGRGGVWPTNPAGSESLARAAVRGADGKVVAGGWIQKKRGSGNGPGATAMLLTRYR